MKCKFFKQIRLIACIALIFSLYTTYSLRLKMSELDIKNGLRKCRWLVIICKQIHQKVYSFVRIFFCTKICAMMTLVYVTLGFVTSWTQVAKRITIIVVGFGLFERKIFIKYGFARVLSRNGFGWW